MNKVVMIWIFILVACTSMAQDMVINPYRYVASGGGTVTILASNTASSNNNVSAPTLTSVPAGSLLVITCANADNRFNVTTTNITSSPTLTWTKRAETPDGAGTSSGMCEIYSATFTAGGDITVTSTWQGVTTASSSVLYSVSNQETSPGGTSGSDVDDGTPSFSVTSTRANSIIFMATSDWNAVSGTLTLRDGATLALNHNLTPSTYRGYHYYKVAATVTTYTLGASAPSGQSGGSCYWECRNN